MNEPLKTVEAAVRALGALPMPVGPEPQALSAERLAEAEERGAHLYEFGGDATADEWNRLAGDDVPALVAEIRRLEAQRAALVVRLRSGQRWERGRTPALISQDFVSQDELRAIFGIELSAPWDEPTDARHPICPEGDDLDARYGDGASDEHVLQVGEARDADVADERGDVDEAEEGGL
ncbi:hypothetical protein OG824_31735 [Streptomyces prunicolor]|uniref:hypothetical protein n=1 Tax=Streptomyces prunicolor TaxID=67348 RepID=UPI0022519284|nr:hypothetical protein [Streptomyces prunicolor]MCX5239782.1 hypothetical protein [Streptomyces prunicolor]